MEWVKLWGNIVMHPSFSKLSCKAKCHYMLSLAYCGERETNGLIAFDDIELVNPWITRAQAMKRNEEITKRDLFLKRSDGFLIENFTRDNPSKEKMVARRSFDPQIPIKVVLALKDS